MDDALPSPRAPLISMPSVASMLMEPPAPRPEVLDEMRAPSLTMSVPA